MEGGNLCRVSLVIREIEMIRQRLLFSRESVVGGGGQRRESVRTILRSYKCISFTMYSREYHRPWYYGFEQNDDNNPIVRAFQSHSRPLKHPEALVYQRGRRPRRRPAGSCSYSFPLLLYIGLDNNDDKQDQLTNNSRINSALATLSFRLT